MKTLSPYEYTKIFAPLITFVTLSYSLGNLVVALLVSLTLCKFLSKGPAQLLCVFSDALPAALGDINDTQLMLAIFLLNAALSVLSNSGAIRRTFAQLSGRTGSVSALLLAVAALLSFDDTAVLFFLTALLRTSVQSSEQERLCSFAITLPILLPALNPVSTQSALILSKLGSTKNLSLLLQSFWSNFFCWSLLFDIVLSEALFAHKKKKKSGLGQNTGKSKLFETGIVSVFPLVVVLAYCVSGLVRSERKSFFLRLLDADSSVALLIATFFYLLLLALVSSALYKNPATFRTDLTEGLKDTLELALILVFSFAFTDAFLETEAKTFLESVPVSPELRALFVFLVSALLSYGAGNCWVAFMMVLSVFSDSALKSPSVLGAVSSGGCLGEVFSVLSESRFFMQTTLDIDSNQAYRNTVRFSALSAVVSLLVGHVLNVWVHEKLCLLLCVLVVGLGRVLIIKLGW